MANLKFIDIKTVLVNLSNIRFKLNYFIVPDFQTNSSKLWMFANQWVQALNYSTTNNSKILKQHRVPNEPLYTINEKIRKHNYIVINDSKQTKTRILSCSKFLDEMSVIQLFLISRQPITRNVFLNDLKKIFEEIRKANQIW